MSARPAPDPCSATTQQAGAPRPLIGDAEGRYRIKIVGNSGTGKSTLGKELSAILGVPYISLDELHWEPGWRVCPDEAFRAKVRAATESNPRGWIVDGDYTRKLGNTILEDTTDVIWLDPPLVLYFPRLCWRTLLRLLRRAPPCSPGCEEMLHEVFFARTSIIWWCLSNHRRVRERYAEPHRVDGVHAGGKLRRIGGWGGELDAWKQDVRRAMVLRGTQAAAADEGALL
ncbi:hypothetical protein BC628DRAFT_1314568 [Trametes gibbosa]|nr:hypothetical protein BC628DRAFT_1314568 [Trametes gibbosa]